MARNTGGKRGDVRQSALWGSGNRGGEFRSNALWGKGGRGLVTTVVAIALAVPLAAGADSGSGSNSGPGSGNGGGYVSHQLKQMGKAHPNDLVSVIVQLDASVSPDNAKKAENEMRKLGKKFGLINGFAGEIRGQDLEKLERISGLTVTLDAPVKKAALGLPDRFGTRRPRSCGRTRPASTSSGAVRRRRRSQSSTPASTRPTRASVTAVASSHGRCSARAAPARSTVVDTARSWPRSRRVVLSTTRARHRMRS